MLARAQTTEWTTEQKEQDQTPTPEGKVQVQGPLEEREKRQNQISKRIKEGTMGQQEDT